MSGLDSGIGTYTRGKFNKAKARCYRCRKRYNIINMFRTRRIRLNGKTKKKRWVCRWCREAPSQPTAILSAEEAMRIRR